MTRLVALCLAIGVSLLLIAFVPALFSAAMSFFESLSARQQGALRAGMLGLSFVFLCIAGWRHRRARAST